MSQLLKLRNTLRQELVNRIRGSKPYDIEQAVDSALAKYAAEVGPTSIYISSRLTNSERNQDIVNRFNNHESIDAIAKSHDLTPRSVRRIIANLNK